MQNMAYPIQGCGVGFKKLQSREILKLRLQLEVADSDSITDLDYWKCFFHIFAISLKF